MYRERFVPSEQQKSFTFPPELYGQEVEIVARPVRRYDVDHPSLEDLLPPLGSDDELPIWKRYPNLNGGELAKKDIEEYLASMTPEERARHLEERARHWAEIDRMNREFDFKMSIRDYHEWRKEAYGYDPDYYKQFNGK
jgi:hypothetical protein